MQDDELHEEHPDPPEEVTGLSTPLMPKRENFFVTFAELHLVHVISELELITNFSKSSEQSLQVYSYIGIFII